MDFYLPILALVSVPILAAAMQPGAKRTGTQAGSIRRAEDMAAIKELVGPKWEADWVVGDASAVAGFYTDNAVLLPKNQTEIAGKEAIRSGFQSFFEHYTIEGSAQVFDAEASWG